MSTIWPSETLATLAGEDLHLAPFRDDGTTYGTLTWVWAVVVDGDVYARAYHGVDSSWYKAAVRQKAGRVRIGGRITEVAFEPVDGPIHASIDAAYAQKYANSTYLHGIVGETQRAATVRIAPRR